MTNASAESKRAVTSVFQKSPSRPARPSVSLATPVIPWLRQGERPASRLGPGPPRPEHATNATTRQRPSQRTFAGHNSRPPSGSRVCGLPHASRRDACRRRPRLLASPLRSRPPRARVAPFVMTERRHSPAALVGTALEGGYRLTRLVGEG